MRLSKFCAACSLSAALSFACGDSPSTASPGPKASDAIDASSEDSPVCATGEVWIPGGEGCTRIGPQCANGFERHASGYGCVPILPETACAEATRPALGSKTCVPVGDCSEAFPPADATVFVDKSATVGETNRFTTIQEAVSKAPDGAVIAVADGAYSENVAANRDVHLTLVGRCPDKAALVAKGDVTAITIGMKLAMRGMTVRGGGGTLVRGELHAENVVFEKAVDRGILARGGKVTLTRSVVRDVGTYSNSFANGISADTMGTIVVDESAITGIVGRGAVVFNAGGSITMKRSVIRDIALAADGSMSHGATAYEGAALSLIESAIVGPLRGGIILAHDARIGTVTRSTVTGIAFAGTPLTASGIDVSGSAKLTLADSTLADNEGVNVRVADLTSSATFSNSAIVAMHDAPQHPYGGAVFSRGTNVVFEDGVIHGAERTAIQAFGHGAHVSVRRTLVTKSGIAGYHHAYAGVATAGAEATFENVTFVDNRELALVTYDPGSRLTLRSSLVRGVAGHSEGLVGMAFYVGSSAYGEIEDSTLEGANGAAVFVSGASALVKSGTLRRNGVAVQAQDGTRLVEGDSNPGPSELVISPSVRFEQNGSRIGSSALAVPEIDLPSPDGP